ncbi:hypothetical protein NMS_0906 [Nonlabens marinus S1-08]|uniref:Uncharacterized protein n=1 Tax=Nonlabens marinus S1-08 TaxID=1454201 RepID=W8VQ81_9FLAO|nr:hypothetical protein NMS_0906 [Nonlabens marinus S1-08]
MRNDKQERLGQIEKQIPHHFDKLSAAQVRDSKICEVKQAAKSLNTLY